MPESSNISLPLLHGDAEDRRPLVGLTLDELGAIMAEMGEPAFRARQINEWLYARRAPSFEAMTSLGRGLRAALEQQTILRTLALADAQRSEDGTIKFLFRTHDGLNIESVLIPSEARDDQDEPKRQTICVSTQVGCPLDCKFCATASMRLKRNLTAGEIVEQFLQVERYAGEKITNIVYMGMGEPMLNYEQVFRSVAIFTEPANELVVARHITISTSGIPSAIRQMADEGQKVKLAVSLHALTNGMRSELMPINRRYDLGELMDAVEYYYRKTRQPVTYEYILFDGWNDTDADIKRLAKITRRVPSKVNVIPFHEIEFTDPTGISANLRSTPREKFDLFIRKAREAGVMVMVRSSSGEDIDAACGQLAVKHDATSLTG
ncbi:MAG: 23S rRNA (adenine(2503)-C(2))-methyltransferase RlmN [Candidatus Kapaibacterium sp.]